MSEEAAFLELLKANPADDTTRLVYADWLDDHNEPEKAEYLRAVETMARSPGGSAEYTDAAVRLFQACVRTDANWRRAAGSRFDVMLQGYDPSYKIHTITIVRSLTGLGLAEAKALVESAPTPIASWLPFEVALPQQLAFQPPRWAAQTQPFRVTIRPTTWPDCTVANALFDVYIAEHHYDFTPGNEHLHGAPYAVQGLSQLLGITEEQARDHLQKLPALIGSGLQPVEVADFVRRMKVICNVHQGLPPNGIRIVPRLPAG